MGLISGWERRGAVDEGVGKPVEDDAAEEEADAPCKRAASAGEGCPPMRSKSEGLMSFGGGMSDIVVDVRCKQKETQA